MSALHYKSHSLIMDRPSLHSARPSVLLSCIMLDNLVNGQACSHIEFIPHTFDQMSHESKHPQLDTFLTVNSLSLLHDFGILPSRDN